MGGLLFIIVLVLVIAIVCSRSVKKATIDEKHEFEKRIPEPDHSEERKSESSVSPQNTIYCYRVSGFQMICRHCDAENPGGATHCEVCGSLLR